MDIGRMKDRAAPVMRKARAYRMAGTSGPTAVSSTEHSPEPFGPFQAVSGEPYDGPRHMTDLRVPPDLRGRVKLFSRIMPDMGRSMIGIFRSAQTMAGNPAHPRRHASPAALAEIDRKARQLGADLVGYTRVDPDYVFAGRRVLDRNVVVLAMEMERASMAKAPHLDAFGEVHHVYADLGLVAFKLAKFLRTRGFAAEAGPALGGDSVYPPLAQRAGIGWVGRNGLLLTEEFGPRVRLAVVYCSIDNLPRHDDSDDRLQWMRSFCDMCGACIRRCPPQALLETPIQHANGALTHVDNGLCFPFFEANYGCGVCIKVCPFSHVDVDRLKRAYERRHDGEEHARHLGALMHAPERVTPSSPAAS